MVKEVMHSIRSIEEVDSSIYQNGSFEQLMLQPLVFDFQVMAFCHDLWKWESLMYNMIDELFSLPRVSKVLMAHLEDLVKQELQWVILHVVITECNLDGLKVNHGV